MPNHKKAKQLREAKEARVALAAAEQAAKKDLSQKAVAADYPAGGGGMNKAGGAGAPRSFAKKHATSSTSQQDLLTSTMTGVLEKLRQQAMETKKMADTYLSQGLLDEYNQAREMQERIEQNVRQVEQKLVSALGLGPASVPVVMTGGAAVPSSTSTAKSTAGSAAGARTDGAERTIDGAHLPARKTTKDLAYGGNQIGGAHAAHASDVGIRHSSTTTSQQEQVEAECVSVVPTYKRLPDRFHYTWTLLKNQKVLEIWISQIEHIPDVDLAPDWLRITGLPDEDLVLTLPISPPCVPDAVKVSRKKKLEKLLLDFSSTCSSPALATSGSCVTNLLVPRLKDANLGFGKVDGFVDLCTADRLRQQVLTLWKDGKLRPGQIEGPAAPPGAKKSSGQEGREEQNLVAAETSSPQQEQPGSKPANKARSDMYAYLDEQLSENAVLRQFTQALDLLLLELSSAEHNIEALRNRKLMRGRPMVTVYTGLGSRYTPHYDCVQGDNGRVATCILYLNPFWSAKDGGVLKLWPETRGRRLDPVGPTHQVEPLHGRLALFLCDSRNLHEVTPIQEENAEPRVAISCWYYDTNRVKEMDCED